MENDYKQQAKQAMEELVKESRLFPGDIVVVGCSTSEVIGKQLGTASAPQVGEQLVAGILEALGEHRLFLAAQCCEHLDRALIMERAAMEKHRLVQVNVVPQPKAGGSLAVAAYRAFQEPVAVEWVQGAAGMDIGNTLIGMHLRPVAVPVRLAVSQIGKAPVAAARTRPKLVGGARAVYDAALM